MNPFRSLAVKLTLAFLLVGLIGAVLVAVLVRRRTQNEFDRLIQDQNQQVLVNVLTRYYQRFGSWEGVERVFRPQTNPAEALSPFQEPGSRWETRRALFAIADQSGTLVFGGSPGDTGRRLNQSILKNSLPLTDESGETIGWLLFTPALDRWRPGTPEGNFLLNVNRATLLSALAATGIALLLGGVLAFSLTRSLREMTAATQALAEGKLGRQVPVRSKDELGELAESFNTMSTELQRANQIRRQMTADIAHDLRSPLSVIMGYTEALSEGKLVPAPEMLSVMHTETQHLSRLIEDLRTLSLADAGELPLNFQEVPPGILLQRAAQAHQVRADHKNLSIELNIQPELSEVRVDVDRMAQVLGNLMENALRYTPAGGEITLSARKGESEVVLEVADTGPGIPEEELPYVFERSFRGDAARQSENGQTGLGLAIARSLVQAQGGRIEAHSEPEKSTTFSISLPAA
jgi:two-component system sensor histidine kinase BaeS